MPWVISKTPSFNVGKLHFSITVKRATGCSDVYFGLTFGKFKNVLGIAADLGLASVSVNVAWKSKIA